MNNLNCIIDNPPKNVKEVENSKTRLRTTNSGLSASNSAKNQDFYVGNKKSKNELAKFEKKYSKSYIETIHNRAIDSLPALLKRIKPKAKLTIDEDGTLIVKGKDMEMRIEDFKNFRMKGISSIGVHKTLIFMVYLFMQANEISKTNTIVKTRMVNIPIKEYAFLRGFALTESGLDEARKTFKKELCALTSIKLIPKDIKGKRTPFVIGNVADRIEIDKEDVKHGYLGVLFTETFAEYLIQTEFTHFTQYPVALFSLSGYDYNAYSLIYKMVVQFHLYTNHKKALTPCKLKVKTLLDNANFPTLKECLQLKRSWQERIKKPLEKALNNNIDDRYLQYWKYNSDFDSFEEWEETTIEFMFNPANALLEKIKEKQQKAKTRQKRTELTKIS